jgi:hypothetical protein
VGLLGVVGGFHAAAASGEGRTTIRADDPELLAAVRVCA